MLKTTTTKKYRWAVQSTLCTHSIIPILAHLRLNRFFSPLKLLPDIFANTLWISVNMKTCQLIWQNCQHISYLDWILDPESPIKTINRNKMDTDYFNVLEKELSLIKSFTKNSINYKDISMLFYIFQKWFTHRYISN